jgi:hypothetical protein
MRWGALISAALLAGCASSTGILPAGPDTYTITERYAPIRGGSDTAQREALTKANEFCAEKGRVFVPNNMVSNMDQSRGFSVTFQCLLPNDPAVANYRLQQAPDLIVEQRHR